MEYKTLFSPTKIGNMEVKNRIVKTAMGVDASDHDGTANEKTVAYYSERAKGDATLMPGRKLESIAYHKLTLMQKNGVREVISADAVVLSLGVRSNKRVSGELKGCCDRLYVIGDARAGKN